MKKPASINAVIGEAGGYGSHRCARCNRALSPELLNYNAIQHHNARKLLCIDAKDCKRARKRAS